MIPGVPADLDVTESHWAIALPRGLDPDCPAAVGNNQTIADSGVPESSCLKGLFRLVLLGRIHNRVTFGDKGKSARRLRQQEQHGKDLPEFNPFEHAYEVILRLIKCGVQQVTPGRRSCQVSREHPNHKYCCTISRCASPGQMPKRCGTPLSAKSDLKHNVNE